MISSLIFQKFSGEGLTEALPRPPPRVFSGFALGLGFALNSRALRALDSGFALDTRALRALDSGFAHNFRLRTLVWPPPKNKFLDPPLIALHWQLQAAGCYYLKLILRFFKIQLQTCETLERRAAIRGTSVHQRRGCRSKTNKDDFQVPYRRLVTGLVYAS